ncbi:alpha/beta hydrolase [Roseobacteraceae bacterium S113]
MALLHVTADLSSEGALVRPHQTGVSLEEACDGALAQSDGPITFLIHGYKYAPGSSRHCPHQKLFSSTNILTHARAASWPRKLRPGGLMIAFGWPARGSIWGAYRRADMAARGLADLARRLHGAAPERSQHIVAHSLGARVALQALHRLDAGSLRTLIVLAGAEYRSVAAAALDTPAGRSAQALHVTSGENDLYDFLFERAIAPARRGDRALGTAPLAHMQKLAIDDSRSLAALGRLGFHIAAPTRRICHWSPYLRPGVFSLYRALIRGDLTTQQLAAALPEHTHRRWSRLLARAPGRPPLSIARDASV